MLYSLARGQPALAHKHHTMQLQHNTIEQYRKSVISSRTETSARTIFCIASVQATAAGLHNEVFTAIFESGVRIHAALYECMCGKNGAHLSALSKIVLHSVRRGHELISPHRKWKKVSLALFLLCVLMKYMTHYQYKQDSRSSVEE
jgi:hypothetical protein